MIDALSFWPIEFFYAPKSPSGLLSFGFVNNSRAAR